MTWQISSTDSGDTERLGRLLGSKLCGGEVIELVADLGGGKTTFTRGVAAGLGSEDNVSSPTFTLKKSYKCKDGLELHHFDFYRLTEPGVVSDQLAESLEDPNVVTVVEWSQIVKEVLPEEKIIIEFKLSANGPDERLIRVEYPESLEDLVRAWETDWKQVQP
jgi:tRNA threonylcarbamoyladenosine biosynthesis protein TsaE